MPDKNYCTTRVYTGFDENDEPTYRECGEPARFKVKTPTRVYWKCVEHWDEWERTAGQVSAKRKLIEESRWATKWK
jgi:hypothetical protein